jgi:hypothetical protein
LRGYYRSIGSLISIISIAERSASFTKHMAGWGVLAETGGFGIGFDEMTRAVSVVQQTSQEKQDV